MARAFDAEEFKRRLNQLPEAFKTRMSVALQKDAEEWVTLAKFYAPKDTRALAESIRHHRTETGGQIVEAGGPTTTREVRAGSGVAVDYAVMEEFGSQHAGAKPFFWISYRSLKRKFRNRRRRALSLAIKDLRLGR